MSENTDIEWADHTFNPWWGCEKVSPACAHCYAEAWARRFGTEWGGEAERRFFGDKHWKGPERWDRAAEAMSTLAPADHQPPRVFCGSMCDVFEDRDDLTEHRERLFDLIDRTPHLIWMLLTKRPENVGPPVGILPNVWIGTTVENQEMAEERIPHLLQIPAPVRFLSCEPLLGPVGLHPWLLGDVTNPGLCVCGHGHGFTRCPNYGGVSQRCHIKGCGCSGFHKASADGLHWVIAGGESGPKARPSHPEWFRSLRDQCTSAGVPFFFKQWGEWWPAYPQYPQDPEADVLDLHDRAAKQMNEPPDHSPLKLCIEPSGHYQPDSNFLHQPRFGAWWLWRAGKKAAGRLLDGREWNQLPDALDSCSPANSSAT